MSAIDALLNEAGEVLSIESRRQIHNLLNEIDRLRRVDDLTRAVVHAAYEVSDWLERHCSTRYAECELRLFAAVDALRAADPTDKETT